MTASQTAFNLQRWSELVADRELAKVQGRVETDRTGRVVLHPIAPVAHGMVVAEIGFHLHEMLRTGWIMVACPISTAGGVRLADLAWASPLCLEELADRVCFPRAPEICVEVVAATDSTFEIQDRMALYFDAGAKEVWTCSTRGAVKFFGPGSIQLERSALCPEFPQKVELR